MSEGADSSGHPGMRRVLVAGSSGAGKSTVARAVAGKLNLPYSELDALHHGPNWTPRQEFRADVERLAAREAWVTEWQYTRVKTLLAERADTVIWLDYVRPLVLWRVVKRTIMRKVRNEELWNGNREPSLFHSFMHPDGVVPWAMRTHSRNAREVELLVIEQPRLRVIRLRNPQQATAWLRAL